ncbi:MAG: hypothetical protein LBH59_00575 [Planctomycetaceae bacterium]|jgi:hypothetical protein|nr:hypothetical protein [Planctomycetaceae bacterium]
MENNYFNRNENVTRVQASATGKESQCVGDTSTLGDAILENARNPKRVQGDAGSVEQHSLLEQIAVERFLQSKKASQNKGLGIRMIKISADGSV